jgi:hypothetical protein
MAFTCGCNPQAGIICGAHCMAQGCTRSTHTTWCIKGERVKTAADLPAGSEVYRHSVTWTKVFGGWRDIAGNHCADEDIDKVLNEGGFITFIPSGRGRWLRQQREALGRG